MEVDVVHEEPVRIVAAPANMPAHFLGEPRQCSAVARSAARPAAPTSRIRRASYISSRVNPCSAARKLNGSLPSDGGPSGMYVPDPCRDWTTPIAARALRPARTDRAAHADVHRELALGRQPIAGTQAPAIDQGADESDDLFGAALDAPAGHGHNWSDQLYGYQPAATAPAESAARG